MLGKYENGLGKSWIDPDYMKSYNDGHVNFAYLWNGMWFMTQNKCLDLQTADTDELTREIEVNTYAP